MHRLFSRWRTINIIFVVSTGEREHHVGVGKHPVLGGERGAHPLPLPGQAVPRLEGGPGQVEGAQGDVRGEG